jgi:hypothetical protein
MLGALTRYWTHMSRAVIFHHENRVTSGIWGLLAFLVAGDLAMAHLAMSGVKGRILAVPGIAMFVVPYLVMRQIQRNKTE